MQSILEGCSTLFRETYILYCSYLKLKIESEKNLCSFIKTIYEESSVNAEILNIDVTFGVVHFIKDNKKYQIRYGTGFRHSALYNLKKKIEQLIIENEKQCN